MDLTTGPHKLFPLILLSTFALAFSPAKQGPNLTSYGEPGPRSNCYIKVDDPHISKHFVNRGEVRVKVNARSVCANGHSHVKLTVEIWKEGFFGSNFVQRFSTNPLAPTSEGRVIQIKSASVSCKDLRPTKYFAYGYANAIVEGKERRTPIAVTEHLKLKCGT